MKDLDTAVDYPRFRRLPAIPVFMCDLRGLIGLFSNGSMKHELWLGGSLSGIVLETALQRMRKNHKWLTTGRYRAVTFGERIQDGTTIG